MSEKLTYTVGFNMKANGIKQFQNRLWKGTRVALKNGAEFKKASKQSQFNYSQNLQPKQIFALSSSHISIIFAFL